MNSFVDEMNYEKTIDLRATPDRVFQALTKEMDRWWTTRIEGSLMSVGDTVKADFPPSNGYWTFEATTLIAGERVELKCIDAYHVVAGQPAEIEKEWLGTMLCWRISANEDGARLHFVHQGLTPKLHCYDICHQGWDFFFATSLVAYLNEGAGMPHSAA